MKSDFRDWSDVRVFLAVVRAGLTLAASKVLGTAQPTVARRIETLEHALGLVLFERDTRGFQPTPEGQALIGQAQAVEAAITAFAEKAGRLIAGRSRTIRITAFKDAFTGRLPTVLADFIRLHGDVQFDLLPSDERLDIAGGEADVAIRVAQKIEDTSLISRKIRDSSFSLFASKAYAEKHPLPLAETEFAGHRFAVFKGREGEFECNKWLLARIEPAQIVMTCEGLSAMTGAVIMGAGIGLLPTNYGRDNDNIVRGLELPLDTALATWLLVNPVAYRRPEVRAFAAFLVPLYRAMFSKN